MLFIGVGIGVLLGSLFACVTGAIPAFQVMQAMGTDRLVRIFQGAHTSFRMIAHRESRRVNYYNQYASMHDCHDAEFHNDLYLVNFHIFNNTNV